MRWFFIVCVLGIACAPPSPGQGTIAVDLSARKHAVSKALFGDQVETHDSISFWNPVAGRPWADVDEQVRASGLSVLRYPGGTLSDFFHWEEVNRPRGERAPQIDPFNTQSEKDIKRYDVHFGIDDVAAWTRDAGVELMITANVGTGSADEAAGWLAHYEDAGFPSHYWEIGNEVWIETNSYSAKTQYKSPEQYAAMFDEYARKLRAINPSVKVGLLGCHDTSGPLHLCQDADWNERVLSSVKERFDFFSVHNSYAPAGVGPFVSADTEKLNLAMLAAPETIAENFAVQEEELNRLAPTTGKDAKFAVTEHAAYFVPAFDGTMVKMLERNLTLASALYSAALFNTFIANPRIGIANHLKLAAPYWQAAVNVDPSDSHSKPFRSSYGHIFKLYSEAAGATVLEVTTTTDVTFDSEALMLVKAMKDVPALHVIAVAPRGGGDKVWLYVVNRSLNRDVETTLEIADVSSATVEQLNGPDYWSASSAGDTDLVALTTREVSDVKTFTFPAHSFTRLRLR